MKNIRVFFTESFYFFELKFSIYLNRRVFVMLSNDCIAHRTSKITTFILRGMDTLSGAITFFFFKLLCLHSERWSTLKGIRFSLLWITFFPFREDPFSEGADVQESKREVKEVVFLNTMVENMPSVSSHQTIWPQISYKRSALSYCSLHTYCATQSLHGWLEVRTAAAIIIYIYLPQVQK